MGFLKVRRPQEQGYERRLATMYLFKHKIKPQEEQKEVFQQQVAVQPQQPQIQKVTVKQKDSFKFKSDDSFHN